MGTHRLVARANLEGSLGCFPQAGVIFAELRERPRPEGQLSRGDLQEHWLFPFGSSGFVLPKRASEVRSPQRHGSSSESADHWRLDAGHQLDERNVENRLPEMQEGDYPRPQLHWTRWACWRRTITATHHFFTESGPHWQTGIILGIT